MLVSRREMGSCQQVQHVLRLVVPRHPCLCARQGRVCRRRPPYSVLHVLYGPFQNVLSVRYEVSGLVGEGEGMEGFGRKAVEIFGHDGG